MGLALSSQAQKKLAVRIASANDDMEELLPGPTQTKTAGQLDAGSSDLEFGHESGPNDPQIVGMRFTNINLPKNAIITKAYIQFTVDATSKNYDPCQIVIKGEDADSSVIFDPAYNQHITQRTLTQDSIYWMVGGSSWGTVGSAGPDQRTPDIRRLIHSIIHRQGWMTGNPIAIMMYGTGTREVESFDGDAAKAPLLVIEYIEPVELKSRIAAADDDQEEWLPGANQTKTAGQLDAGSSDLEFGTESKGNDPQMVGMRFTNLNIPQGSQITKAFIQFTVDATSKNQDPCEVYIKVEDTDSANTFNPSQNFDITSRSKYADSVTWKVGGTTWATVGSKSAEQATPDISELIQKIVDRGGWKSGNALSLFMHGTGTREVESFDGDAANAPLLVVQYLPMKETKIRVSAADDDQEEWLAAANQSKTAGQLDAGSSDLELGNESSGNDPQMVGIRFNNIPLSSGSLLKNAYIQFTVDATSKNTNPCDIYIKVEDSDSASTFDPNQNFNITSRAKSQDSTYWAVTGSTWGTVGSAGPEQRTANIASLIEWIIGRPGWKAGNSIAFYLTGSGTREVESYDGDAAKAPLLVIETLEGGTSAPRVPMAVTNYPVLKKSEWAFHDSANTPSGSWNQLSYSNELDWNYGRGYLGYGEPSFESTTLMKGNPTSPAAYFRKRFVVSNLSAVSDTIELQVLADDGAVVFINGIEVARKNMPSGTISHTSTSNSDLNGSIEKVYALYYLPKSVLKADTNVLAVEVHQSSSSSDDMLFDVSLQNRQFAPNPSASGCVSGATDHISCFTSVIPALQEDTVIIPSTHSFQLISMEGDAYPGGGNIRGSYDFTAYMGQQNSSKKGTIGLNHEIGPEGGVSLIDVHFNCAAGKWVQDTSMAVDFGNELVRTERNCSGGISPWGTMITSEETGTTEDKNGDGYVDVGWNVEIDPVTRQVKQYGNGKREKLWALGNMSHENVCFKNDSVTVYQGEDASDGGIYKFVADQKTNLSKGKLYVLKLDQPLDAKGEPQSSTGTWVLLKNGTATECNSTRAQAAAAGSTLFNGVEDLEINPLNGDIYAAVKGVGRVYSFTDNGSTVSGFKTFIGGTAYPVNYGSGVVLEDWGGGNDNLTFDDKGNLWVLQDGGKNHVWLVRPGHTQTSPKVELFMRTPAGSEPTGMTFTPDYKYMFISIQGPNGSVTQKDIHGKSITFNKSAALVVARKEMFNSVSIPSLSISGPNTAAKGSTQTYTANGMPGSTYSWTIVNGTKMSGGNTQTITVQWGSSGNGEVQVVENVNKDCQGALSKLNVSLTSSSGVDYTDITLLNIWPNPATSNEVLINQNVQGRIIDMNGKEVARVQGNTIQISGLPNGMYILYTMDGQSVKFQIER